MKLTNNEIIRIQTAVTPIIEQQLTDYQQRLAQHLSSLVAYPQKEILKLIEEVIFFKGE